MITKDTQLKAGDLRIIDGRLMEYCDGESLMCMCRDGESFRHWRAHGDTPQQMQASIDTLRADNTRLTARNKVLEEALLAAKKRLSTSGVWGYALSDTMDILDDALTAKEDK